MLDLISNSLVIFKNYSKDHPTIGNYSRMGACTNQEEEPQKESPRWMRYILYI